LDSNQQTVIGGSRFLTFTNGCNGSEAAIDNYMWRTSASHLKAALHPARFSAFPMAAISLEQSYDRAFLCDTWPNISD
jgi:hypothetical protein